MHALEIGWLVALVACCLFVIRFQTIPEKRRLWALGVSFLVLAGFTLALIPSGKWATEILPPAAVAGIVIAMVFLMGRHHH